MLESSKIEAVDLPTMVQAWLSGFQARRAGVRLPVCFDDSGITQITSSSQTHFVWRQVTAVYAYKRDCFGTDQIRVVLGDETLKNWIDVAEDDEGYQELIAALPVHLPGCLAAEEWWRCVAVPAFDAQWMQLYQRT